MTNTNLKAQIDNNITNETAPLGITPSDVGSNMKAVVDYVDQEAALKVSTTTFDAALLLKEDKYFKIYKGKLSQSGTDNITSVILKNNTTKTFTFTRNSTGSYSINFSSIYSDLNKVDIYIHLQTSSYAAPQVLIDNLNVLAIIETKYWNGSTFVLSDGILQNSTLYLIVND